MAGGKNRTDKATYRCPPCPTMLVCHHRLSWRRRRGICDVKTTKHAVSTLHNLVFPTSRLRSTAMPIRRSLLRHPLSYERKQGAVLQRPHRGERRKRSNSPDAADVLADLVRVRALELAQFRIPLNLEEHLLAVLRRHLCVPWKRNRTCQLCGHGRTKVPFSHPPTQCPPLAHTQAEPPTANSRNFGTILSMVARTLILMGALASSCLGSASWDVPGSWSAMSCVIVCASMGGGVCGSASGSRARNDAAHDAKLPPSHGAKQANYVTAHSRSPSAQRPRWTAIQRVGAGSGGPRLRRITRISYGR